METTSTTVQRRTARHPGRWSRRIAALVVAMVLGSACATGNGPPPGVTPVGQQTGTAAAGFDSAEFDWATREDAEFNRLFRHEFADVDGVRMHYVTGGSGPPLVLLHGWPQSWYAWRDIMPALAEHHTVYPLDLPGLGDSEGAPPGFDKAALARYVHGLVADELGLGEIDLVGPGAESPFTDAQVDEYARTYGRPQVLTGGFELYRTLDQDERDNVAAAPVTVPTMLMTAEGLLASTRPTVEPRISNIVRAVEVPGAGHWLMAENPEFVTAELLAFLAG